MSLQKSKADGPTDPQQPAKKKPPPEDTESSSTPPVSMATPSSKPEDLLKEIAAQGDKVRVLKAAKADKVGLPGTSYDVNHTLCNRL